MATTDCHMRLKNVTISGHKSIAADSLVQLKLNETSQYRIGAEETALKPKDGYRGE